MTAQRDQDAGRDALRHLIEVVEIQPDKVAQPYLGIPSPANRSAPAANGRGS